ncbi:hypothetical protein CUJ83_13065 [Methanocella sp. CWC-04]|uniref:Uncharacterized protein n=1 Tax=Methanooceanicella nereidis TaxID=2052831 RepID=A0AAP2RFN2_9EURY|nr:hypothetical protein [Methanocella sp. CWC-04]MCD1295926.1 hypothetical protein [Methanocella sp. CWC-04]
MDRRAPGSVKYLSWLLIGMLSVFFAEVMSGSYLFPYFTVWGILVVMPLYTLHTLVFAHVVFNYGKPRLYTLFLAGVIFGLYEAYITKVLWNPPWGASLFAGGVAIIELAVIAMWWHPFMAFIAPLFVSENVLSKSKDIFKGLPAMVQRLCDTKKKVYILLALFVIFFGLVQSANSPSPIHSLASVILGGGAIMALLWIYRSKTSGLEYSLKELLPDKKEFVVLLAALLLFYAMTGIVLRPEALPGIGPQLLILLIYAVMFALLYLSLKKSKKIEPVKTVGLPVGFSWKLLAVLTVSFALVSAIGNVLHIGLISILLAWLLWGITGIIMMILSARDAIGRVS